MATSSTSLLDMLRKRHIVAHMVLITASILFIAPFAWMVSTSLKHESRIFGKAGEAPQWVPTTEVRTEDGGRMVILRPSTPEASEALALANTGAGVEAVDKGRDEDGRHTLTLLSGASMHVWPEDFEIQQQIGLHWENYADAFEVMDFWQNLRNTLFICYTVVLGTLLSCSLVAYSFSRIEWPGRDLLFMLVLATMMLPYSVTLIPLFAVYRQLGWVGTFKPLIVPAFFGTAFYIFLLRQFFMSIPRDLSAAARIDGCTEFGIFSRIVLPLSKPALATTALFMFMFQWGDFLNPLIYLQDDRQYTLAIALQQFQSQHESAWGALMAMSTVITLPIIVLFFFTQRTFIQGITMTGLKG